MRKPVDHISKSSFSGVKAAVAAALLSQASGCISLHFGRQETTVIDRKPFDIDDFESRFDRANDTRDRLRDCVLNAPINHPQFENTSQERFGGTYESGKFVYKDEVGQEVSVKVTSDKSRFTSREEVRVWGGSGSQEEALKACEDVY